MNSTWIIQSNAEKYSIYLNSNNGTFSSTILSVLIDNSTDINDIFSPKITKCILIILVSLMTLMTVTGNSLVIIAFIVEPRLRTYSNYFILNLSIADLLIGLIW